jgi:predicted lipoprotein with Yx(FWY)xxD motif
MRTKWIAAGVVALGLVLSACSSSSKTSAGASASTAATTPTTAANAALVAVANNPKFGSLLVGSNGRTLYLLETEKGTTSDCTGACAQIWPALTASGQPTGASGVDAARLSKATGQVSNQVVYNGHLLYFFSGDAAPGDVKGTGIPHWYPVSPAGDKIDKY